MKKPEDFPELETVLAVDPGPSESAYVFLDFESEDPGDYGIVANEELKESIIGFRESCDHLAIEMVACYGMPVGRDVFETVLYIGQLMTLWHLEWENCTKIYRHDEKIVLCHNARAKDSNIRQALIDRYGGERKAIGGDKCPKCKGKGWFGRGRPECPRCGGDKWDTPPGPLYEFKKDLWAALAVGLAFKDLLLEERIDLDTLDHRA